MINQSYRVVIGLETHVQLSTKTKLFCGCNNDSREAAPNTNICPVCLGLPGTLPVLNGAAVNLAMVAGLALNYTPKPGTRSKFDRKNYFYPDLPKGYQITQFDEPIVGVGYVDVPLDGESFRVGITRAHLEEDAGKLTHPEGKDYSLVDLNRAGTPLLEIVSEPDISSASQAKAYAHEMYIIMRCAAVSQANMYYGNMRFDVNVSVHKPGEPLGTRTETKNLNSFKAIEKTVEYETNRQIDVLEVGGKIVQETRGWDDNKQITYSQRSKEDAHDYRYFPEPDLPPIIVSQAMIDDAVLHTPEYMPAAMRQQLKKAGLGYREVEILINLDMAKLCLQAGGVAGASHIKRLGDWLSGAAQKLSSEQQLSFANTELSKTNLAELSKMMADNQISSTAAKTILLEMAVSQQPPLYIAKKLDLLQVSDSSALQKIVVEIIAANPKPVADVRAGELKAMGFLVGQAMKASRGQANPSMIQELLKSELGLL